MKVIRKILYGIAVMSALLCILVVVCAFRPDFTDKIAGFLYQNQDRTATAARKSEPDPAKEAQSVVYLPKEQGKEEESDSGRDDEAEQEAQEREPDEGQKQAIEEEDAIPAPLDYVAPEEADIVIPDSVSGRSGYQQVQGNEEQVDDAAAGDLLEQLGMGDTGDELTFDPVYYPFYGMLDDKGQCVYRQIYANANALYPVFMPAQEVSASQLKSIFEAVYNDHPELFFLETAYTCKYMRTGQCVEIDLKFNKTAGELDSARADFESQADSIVVKAQDLPDAYAKEKFVHDVLLDRITYNSRARMNQSAYSALVDGETVCAGYARAFQYILQKLGIPCYYCTGYAGESHAWNIVALEDGFYNVDVTWDDSGAGKYDFFNKTDEDYARNHIRQELSVHLPPCTGQAYRNLEPSEGNEQVRSLEDVGIMPEQVITNLDRYYEDCYNQIVQNGKGHYTFSNVIEGENLLNEWDTGYKLDQYKQAYMEHAMSVLEAAHCEMALEVEALQDGRYLVMHEVTLTD